MAGSGLRGRQAGGEPQLRGNRFGQEPQRLFHERLLERPQEDVPEPSHLLAFQFKERGFPVHRLYASHECLHRRESAHPISVTPYRVADDPTGRDAGQCRQPLRP